MNIEEIPNVSEWLAQFDNELPDQYLARYLLKKIRYVSFEEMEAWLQHELQSVIDEILKSEGNKVPIAIFPVAKPFIHEFNQDKEEKPPNDSSGRIAHSLKNLERRLPEYVEVTPRDDSMKERKVKHIIFVDDFIGTGDRFVKSWRSTVSRRVKSWCSHGWCKIWLVSFAGHDGGLSHIVNQIRPVIKERVRINLRIKKSFIWANIELAKLSYRYGDRLNKSKARLGYGKLLSPVIFQYGCPNNAPGIFWSKGKRGKKRWKPLFPERSVATELYPLFNTDMSNETTPEELWMVGHHDLAVEIIDDINNYHGGHHLMMILGFLDKNKDINKIRSVLVLTDAELDEKMRQLLKHGLIDSDNKVTQFGKDILKRGKKTKRIQKDNNEEYKNFYPASFLGFQREI